MAYGPTWLANCDGRSVVWYLSSLRFATQLCLEIYSMWQREMGCLVCIYYIEHCMGCILLAWGRQQIHTASRPVSISVPYCVGFEERS